MAGIVFYKTTDVEAVHAFYTSRMGCRLWHDQGACRIYSNGNLLIGFCKAEKADMQSVITFFYPSQEEVAHKYDELKDVATTEPLLNDRFNIYQFYAEDPEGRTVEVQFFNHDIGYDFARDIVEE